MWTWLPLLGLAIVVALVVALPGARPRGAKPVGNTRLMGAARIVLLILGAIILYAWLGGGNAP
ncbi:MAG: hypothetical protein QOD06_2931 [Candidatus Binatota bacterium]|nr:hypothetical protein [Candidatus Binatota bacterium]